MLVATLLCAWMETCKLLSYISHSEYISPCLMDKMLIISPLMVVNFFFYSLNGTSGPCETFGNMCLAHKPEFELKNVEVRLKFQNN